MDKAVRDRFDQVDAHMAELDGIIERIDAKLIAIGRQNEAMSEMVEMLGRYTNVGLEGLQRHLREDH